MSGVLIVMTGVLMFRRVTAQHLATGLANAEMHPATIDAKALFTAKHGIVGFRDDAFQSQFIEMLAGHKFCYG
jgi:hypothetical protein